MSSEQKRQHAIDEVIAKGPFAASWDSLMQYEIPQWYEDAKFGIFIHWGLYSVPAFKNEWYARHMYLEGTPEFEYHLKTYGAHAEFGYKDFIPQFTAEKFDPAQWAELFKKSGAKFVMPVAEHHDGFALYNCSFSDWNTVKKGPGRDIIGELAPAVQERNMVFSVSYHRAEHYWFFDGGLNFESDVRDCDLYGPPHPGPSDHVEWHNFQWKPGPSKEFLDEWLARLQELVDTYQPQVVWFDWWINHEAFVPYLQKFAAYYYNRGVEWGKGVAINYKYDAYPKGTAVFDVERGQLSDIRPKFWQTDTSVSKSSWGYTQNQNYKTTSSIIHDLVDIVSKNGALLLNIGPRPDGSIPEPEVDMLLEIGQWLNINGEAMYGTRPWRIFGEGPTDVPTGAFTDTQRAAFTSEDIRFTQKNDDLYATLLAWPNDRATIKALANQQISDVTLLGHQGKLSWTVNNGGLHVDIPSEQPCEHAFVLKISGKQLV